MTPTGKPHVVVIGGGFTGLAAAYELTHQNVRVTLVEKESQLGGLATSFNVGGELLEKFYHHWFTSDTHVLGLAKELGGWDRVGYYPIRSGIYVTDSIYSLSSPLDLLRFRPLKIADRLRLGLLLPRAHWLKNWIELDSLTTREWLLQTCGRNVYETLWEPLLRGQFGPYASRISAAWFQNKIVLRGGSRGKTGLEVLAYFRGSLARLAELVAERIKASGGKTETSVSADALIVEQDRVRGVQTSNGTLKADAVIATMAPPIVSRLLEETVPGDYVEQLKQIRYLANTCVVLELDRSLSDFYWVNVADKDFPFVGVIEHTNMIPSARYGGVHIVYLSKYLPDTEKLYQSPDHQILDYSLPFLERIFPRFSPDWVLNAHVWRGRFAQPIVECHYSRKIPWTVTPVEGFFLCSMAQIYPEDRGTNYAVREGRKAGRICAAYTHSL
jgi:protoporphyrinogen oxidase